MKKRQVAVRVLVGLAVLSAISAIWHTQTYLDVLNTIQSVQIRAESVEEIDQKEEGLRLTIPLVALNDSELSVELINLRVTLRLNGQFVAQETVSYYTDPFEVQPSSEVRTLPAMTIRVPPDRLPLRGERWIVQLRGEIRIVHVGQRTYERQQIIQRSLRQQGEDSPQ